MSTNMVKFVQGNSVSFAGITPDENTIYFIEDEKRIYKGKEPYSGGMYVTVEQYPSTGKLNTIYINTTDGSVQYWNGTAYQEIVKPTTTDINATLQSNKHFPTSKAVADYIISKLSSSEGALNDKIAALEEKDTALQSSIESHAEQLATIQGVGVGSIAKAKSEAQTYADNKVKELSEGQVTTNANNIQALQQDITAKFEGMTEGTVQASINSAIGSAGHLKRQTVVELPKGNIDVDTIYMVKNGSGQDSESTFTEWMYIDGKWEKIGDTKIDLEPYATKEYADQAEQDAITTAGTNADNKIKTKVGAIGDNTTVKTYVDKAQSEAYQYADTQASNAQQEAILAAQTDTQQQITNLKLKDASQHEAKEFATATQGLNGQTAYDALGTYTGQGAVGAGIDAAKSAASNAKIAASNAETNAKKYADTKTVEAKQYTDNALAWNVIS